MGMKFRILYLLLTLALILGGLPIGSVTANTSDLVLERDYGEGIDDDIIGVDMSLACSKVYRNTKTGEKVMVIDQLPHVDARNSLIEPEWLDYGSYFSSKQNTFICIVDDNLTTIVVENDQGNGLNNGDTLQYSPQMFLGGREVFPKSVAPKLLDVDSINSYYSSNVLVWDYKYCSRYLRLIEGKIQGYWEFTESPGEDVTFVYNQEGDFNLILGTFARGLDREFIPIEDLESLLEEFGTVRISDSATFYPDAHPESASVDGSTLRWDVTENWATIRAGAGTHVYDDWTSAQIQFNSRTGSDWKGIYREIELFDTSSLPDDANISAATLSIYGTSKQDALSLSANFALNVYTSNPASNTALVTADHVTYGTTELATSISYGSYNTSGFNNFTLNSTGLAKISTTSVSEFGIREAYYDAAGNTPSSGADNESTACVFYTTDQGGATRPKLEVTYTEEVKATYYPSADGRVTRYIPAAGQSWTTVVESAGTHSNATNANDYAGFNKDAGGTAEYQQNSRTVFMFDTSDLPSNAIVISGTFSLYGHSVVDEHAGYTASWNVYSCSPGTHTAVQASDYNVANWGSTALSDNSITSSSINTAGYNHWVLNASGLAEVDVGGWTDLGIRMVGDASVTDPNLVADGAEYFYAYMVEQGGSYRPVLKITYEISEPEPGGPPGRSNSLISPFGGPGGMFF